MAAINLGEILTPNHGHLSLQLKGAGATPYSRTADGLAVLRSSIREYLCSEAMYHLGVPTTRALSLILTGEQVMRDIMYNGNSAYEPGAVVCRVAPSFIRFGNFQLLASRNEIDELRQLADFTIKHHFSELLQQHEAGSKDLYLAWFQKVCELTVEMVVHWMRVGFVHGVMNTDNMSILGLTIDYGPYGWLDNFDADWTPNTTDAQNRRYRYGQQPNICLWNCYQLANALYPLIEDTDALEEALDAFQQDYQNQWRTMMTQKLGLLEYEENDDALFADLETLLAKEETDMTLFYRALANESLSVDNFRACYYQRQQSDDYKHTLNDWLQRYQLRLNKDNRDAKERLAAMNSVNPLYVFRNYLAQQAIDKADAGDYSMVNELLDVFRTPYTEQKGKELYAEKRPDWARSKVGCSMLSCSS